MIYFNHAFGRYCGHFQGEIITSVPRNNVVSCAVIPWKFKKKYFI